MYKSLSERGIFTITRWAISPYNDATKLFVNLKEMLKRYNVNDYERKLLFIRSANTVTICISKKEIGIEKVIKFSLERSFEILYIDPSFLKKENLKRSYFEGVENLNYKKIQTILATSIENFVKNYSYNVSIVDDNKPYYYNFFNLNNLKLILSNPQNILPFHEWGYGIWLLMLLPVMAISIVFIFLPLAFLDKEGNIPLNKKVSIFTYFFYWISIFLC